MPLDTILYIYRLRKRREWELKGEGEDRIGGTVGASRTPEVTDSYRRSVGRGGEAERGGRRRGGEGWSVGLDWLPDIATTVMENMHGLTRVVHA